MYDKSSKESIYKFAKKLLGKNFNDIRLNYNIQNGLVIEENIQEYAQNIPKGNYGHIIEKEYFGLTINNEQRPDFEEAKVELKVSPYERTMKGLIKAGERLVITMIPYDENIEATFEESEVFKKINHILFVLYYRNKIKYPNPMEYPIDFVDMFSFYETLSEEDQLIIRQDYNYIQSKIKAGKAHELSEGETYYLGACTKGQNAEKSYRKQHYNDEELAKGRAFSFKQSFFTRLINDYIINKKIEEEKIIKNPNDLDKTSFENIVITKLETNIGKSETELFKLYNINTNAKNKYSLLAFRMLGIKSNSAEEFTKAGIVVKTIRMERDTSIIEHMSFTNIDLIQFASEEWMESYIYNYFRETKFLFLIFKQNSGVRIFKGAQFWNMPIQDLIEQVQKDWKKTQDVINKGVTFSISGNRVRNNIPSPSKTNTFHIRPKAKKSAYKILVNNELYVKGDIETDGTLLPNGEIMTKQSFWLNREYIIKQLENKFFD